MQILSEIESLGVDVEVRHYRLYKGYGGTDKMVKDYFDVPRRVDMEDVCDFMLTKDEANAKQLDPNNMLPRGGQTHIIAYHSETGEIVLETSTICSLKDGYCKAEGINRAGKEMYNRLIPILYEEDESYEWQEITDNPENVQPREELSESGKM